MLYTFPRVPTFCATMLIWIYIIPLGLALQKQHHQLADHLSGPCNLLFFAGAKRDFGLFHHFHHFWIEKQLDQQIGLRL